MAKIKEVLEQSGYPAARLVWKVKKGQEKPGTYYTFQPDYQAARISSGRRSKRRNGNVFSKNYYEMRF